MSYLSTLKTLILVSFVSILLGGCSSGSGGEDSDHGLVPTPTAETNVTDTNTSAGGSGGGTDTHTAPDTNGTGGHDTNTTTGGGGNDTNTSTGGSDTNDTAGGNDTNASTGGNDDNGTIGGSDDGNSTGGDSNGTTGGGSNDGNATGGDDTNTTVRLSTLNLTAADTILNKDHNTTVTLTATYDDNTTKPLTGGITWIITPQEAVTLHGTTLTALKDTNVTVQAKVGTTLSNAVSLNIYWEVNGHRLPPEPDPAVNNSTLLGVDVNGNGVRDDVERWIYETYKHPIERAVFMQLAKALQYRVRNEDRDKNERIKDEIKAGECYIYWSLVANKISFYDFHATLEQKQFNTIDRKNNDKNFQKKFNGMVLPDNGIESKDLIEQCDFNATKLMKDHQ